MLVIISTIPTRILILLCLFVSININAKWETLDTNGTPSKRHENGAVVFNNEIYIIGGRGIKPIDIYDPKTNIWRQNKKPPFELHHITPVALPNKILIVSGFTGKYPKETPLSHIWEYYPVKDKWVKGKAIPKSRQRGAAGVTIYDNKVYIVGGAKQGHTSGTTNMFDQYDTQTNQWTTLTDAPHIRDHSNLVILDSMLVSLAGRNTSYHEPESFTAFFGQVNHFIDVYNFDNASWHTLSSRLPIGWAGAGALVHNNNLYIVGGENASKAANNRMFSFNFSTKTFYELESLNQGRHGTNAIKINDTLYFAMGSGNRGGRPELKSIEAYRLNK